MRKQLALVAAFGLLAVLILARGACDPAPDEGVTSTAARPARSGTPLAPPGESVALVPTAAPTAPSEEVPPPSDRARPTLEPPPPEEAQRGGAGRLRGTVVTQDQKPVPLARVRFQPAQVGVAGFEVTCDEKGAYAADAPRASWHVTASAAGLIPCSEDVAIRPGQEKVLDPLVLLPAGRLVVSLVDAESLVPVDGTVVATWTSSGEHDAVGWTAGGGVTLDVPQASVRLMGKAKGHAAARETVVVGRDGASARLALRAASTLTGRVRTAAGEPVATARVVVRVNGRSVGYCEADPDGAYRVANVPAGRASLLVTSDDPPLAAASELTVARASELSFDVIVTPAGRVAVKVRAGDEPLDCTVTATPRGSVEALEGYPPGGFAALVPGEYTFRASRFGVEIAVREGVLVRAGESEVVLAAGPLGRLSGVIAPAARASVHLQRVGAEDGPGAFARLKEKDGGRYAFDHLPPGTYRLAASAPEGCLYAAAVLTLGAGETTQDLRLEPAVDAVVALRDASGPATRAAVKVTGPLPDMTGEWATDREGKLALRLVPPGVYSFECKGKRARVELAAGKSTPTVLLE